MFAGTERYSGSRHVCVSIIFIAFRLYEAGTFFVPSRPGGISLSATGISLSATGICDINASSRLTGTNSIFHSDNSCSSLKNSFDSIILFVLTLK